MKTNKIFAAVKLVAVGVFALAVTGCGLIPPKVRSNPRGMVWEATIVRPQLSMVGEVSPELTAKTHYDPTRDFGMRISKVQFGEGWDMGIMTAKVPDQIEFSQLSRGTVVEVKVEYPDTVNMDTSIFTRILRVVCDSEDDKCIDAEKAAKRYKAIVDKNPPEDVSAKYGATFNRRLSPEENAKYQ